MNIQEKTEELKINVTTAIMGGLVLLAFIAVVLAVPQEFLRMPVFVRKRTRAKRTC